MIVVLGPENLGIKGGNINKARRVHMPNPGSPSPNQSRHSGAEATTRSGPQNLPEDDVKVGEALVKRKEDSAKESERHRGGTKKESSPSS